MTLPTEGLGAFVSAIVSGVSPPCETATPNEEEYAVLTLAAITSGRLVRNAAKRIGADRVDPSWPTVLQDRILIARASGSRHLVGACALPETDLPKRIIPDTVWRLDLKAESQMPSRYLLEFLRSGQGRRALTRIARGSSGIHKISKRSFRGLAVPVMSPAAMSAIARLAAGLDGMAECLARMVWQKRAFRRGLAQQLLAGRKRFRQFARPSDTQPVELTGVPGDWQVVEIGEIAHERKERGVIEGAVVYSCTKHDGLVPSLEYFGKQVFSRNLEAYKRVNPGDFAYATNHIEEGSIGLLAPDRPAGLVSPMYTVFRCVEGVDSEFLYAVLKSETYRRVFEKRTTASVNRRGSLRWKKFARIQVGIPQIGEQQRIVDTLRCAQREIDLLQGLRASTELRKRALMHRLLSGEISLSGLA